MTQKALGVDTIRLDASAEVEAIGAFMRQALTKEFRRRGIVVGISGGIDSAVTAALAVKCLGKDRVFCLLMPERESSPETLILSRLMVDHLGTRSALEDITGALEAVGFYSRYQEAVRRVAPEYGPGWTSKLVATESMERGGFTFFSLVVANPQGDSQTVRLPVEVYLEIVATTNFKQRCRKVLEYYYADRWNFAVAGTPNLLEYDQGFFVKNGDGAADIKPIAHLYKTQVYQLAEFLGVPKMIRDRPPTTDTFSMAQGQDEFYFALPYQKMDLCLYGLNHQIDPDAVGRATGLSADQVRQVWANLQQKRSTVQYQHASPLIMRRAPETTGRA
ncbi:MAG: NAD(+) synthase [Verrucomicrobia bacterium]|nr:NAD(+) synthase [Verrucomicrobiota bacterium]MBI3870801.1 NAD(+) synthase [Verrucomicrobiota bacterium]